MKYNAANTIIPDVNSDGAVNAADSAMILEAYTNIQQGLPSGLTEEQEKAADANMDGEINAIDSSMVIDFYTKRQASDNPYKDMSIEAAWAAYLNDYFHTGGEVY